eukprot:GHVR01120176.1.p1 GENE.GHVR01120176.1~~GHVR01120176.1.p1  ORF type:complete len:381 (+),score=74.12 GHVR01120176.1:46-1188(+)
MLAFMADWFNPEAEFNSIKQQITSIKTYQSGDLNDVSRRNIDEMSKKVLDKLGQWTDRINKCRGTERGSLVSTAYSTQLNLFNTGCLQTLVNELPFLNVEIKNALRKMFTSLLDVSDDRYNPTLQCPIDAATQPINNTTNFVNYTATYLAAQPGIHRALLESFVKSDCAQCCGWCLREYTRVPYLHHMLFVDESVVLLCLRNSVSESDFDVASESIATAEAFLLATGPQRETTKQWLTSNYEKFCLAWYKCLHTDANFVTQRNALALMVTVATDLQFFECFTRTHLADPQNLALYLSIIKDVPSTSLQESALHLVKIWFALPPAWHNGQVASLMQKNAKKVITFVESFQLERDTDLWFKQEKDDIIHTVQENYLLTTTPA